MEQVTNEKKILGILMKQNLNRKIAGLLSKIGRLINISDYTGGAATPPLSPLSTLMCLNALCVVFCALSHDASHFCNR